MRYWRDEIAKYAYKILELESALACWLELPTREWPFNRRNAMRRLWYYRKRLAELQEA